MHIPPLFLWNDFLYIFFKEFSRIFVLLVMTKKIIFVFFSFFHMLWYVQFSLHPPFFTRCGIHSLLNAIISTRNVAYAYLKRDVWYSFLMIITEKTNSAEINTQVLPDMQNCNLKFRSIVVYLLYHWAFKTQKGVNCSFSRLYPSRRALTCTNYIMDLLTSYGK